MTHKLVHTSMRRLLALAILSLLSSGCLVRPGYYQPYYSEGGYYDDNYPGYRMYRYHPVLARSLRQTVASTHNCNTVRIVSNYRIYSGFHARTRTFYVVRACRKIRRYEWIGVIGNEHAFRELSYDPRR